VSDGKKETLCGALGLTYAMLVKRYRVHMMPTLHRDMPLNLVVGFLISPSTCEC
jgi:hypothetical protein